MFFIKFSDRLGDKNRAKKFDSFMDVFRPDGKTRILDVGAAEGEFRETANILEKRYPFPENITVLGVDDFQEFPQRYPKVRVVTYDGRKFPFQDKEFDVCWCNAVIEHVGDRSAQKLFLSEIKRVAKKAFVTTPNRWFPFELHTGTPLLHLFPKKFFDWFLRATKQEWAAGDFMHLLSLGDIKRLLHDCGIEKYEIRTNKVCGMTVDFVIIF